MRRFLFASLALAGCSSDPVVPPPPGTRAAFDLSADVSSEAHFWDFPFPSDARLRPDGTPDWDGFPNPDLLPSLSGFVALTKEHRGFALPQAGYFRFDAPLAERDPTAVVPASVDAPILLVDVDPDSPELGRLIPTVSHTPPVDGAVPEDFLTVAPRPGFVLRGETTYAYVVRRELRDAAGELLGVPDDLATFAAGGAPAGALAAAAKPGYDLLFAEIDALGVAREEVAAAAVFTTGDVVADTAALTTQVVAAHDVAITDLALDADGTQHQYVCELVGKIVYPQFQGGAPPFDTDGLFVPGPDGLPIKQRDEEAPVRIAIPKQPMPDGGYPLEVFIHGSGGYSYALLDPVGGDPGSGPAEVVGRYGIAVAGSAMPLNPERFPGASEIEYVNVNNFPAVRDTFRQGSIETRLFIEALSKLEIPAAALAACPEATLPNGATGFRFDTSRLLLAGQSMGAWYTNLVTPQEPAVRAIIPTGGGGYFPYFLLNASPAQSTIHTLGGAAGFVVLGSPNPITFMHPAAMLFETAAEAADPYVYLPRVSKRPLPGHLPRSIYEPAGKDDSYFNEVVYDAFALAYENRQAGDLVWQSMQDALGLAELDGLVPFPIEQNLVSEAGDPYTAAVSQWDAMGAYDAHALYSHHPVVRFQFGCFAKSFVETGVATIFPPADLGAPCQ